jgi:hypothetical protein
MSYLLINWITPLGVQGISPVKSPMATLPSFIMFKLHGQTGNINIKIKIKNIFQII